MTDSGINETTLVLSRHSIYNVVKQNTNSKIKLITKAKFLSLM